MSMLELAGMKASRAPFVRHAWDLNRLAPAEGAGNEEGGDEGPTNHEEGKVGKCFGHRIREMITNNSDDHKRDETDQTYDTKMTIF